MKVLLRSDTMNNTATQSTQAKPAPFKSGVKAGDNGPGGIFNPD